MTEGAWQIEDWLSKSASCAAIEKEGLMPWAEYCTTRRSARKAAEEAAKSKVAKQSRVEREPGSDDESDAAMERARMLAEQEEAEEHFRQQQGGTGP